MSLYTYAKAYMDGQFDGEDADVGSFVVLRYMNTEQGQEDGEVIIDNPDWYAVAWVKLLQLLPDGKVIKMINEPTFPALADHVKYWVVIFEVIEVLEAYHFEGLAVRKNRDGDIVLCTEK
jgi:hypothetical protein